MTSRARRIVLAMYGHRAYTPVTVTHATADVPPYYTAHCCYEAMDDVDDLDGLIEVTDTSWADGLTGRRVLVGGNFGLPCA